MKITKIQIKNLFGIQELTLDGKNAEFDGTNGVGKSSVLDAIRYALENKSNRDMIIHKGAEEGEIVIETNTGLSIHRKVREGKADYKSIKQDNHDIQKPEAFLDSIFSPLQLNPVEFTQMTRQEQNRAILSLIEFDWDLDWIKKQFGEIPQGVDYDQHILKVLDDIQSEKGNYYKRRQDINREILHKKEFRAQIAKSLPDGYDEAKWKNYDFNERYTELTRKKENNARIARAKVFYEGYEAKVRAAQAERDSQIISEKQFVEDERKNLESKIERYKHEIELAESQLKTVDSGLESKIAAIRANYEAQKAKIDKDNAIAADWSTRQVEDITDLQEEVSTATEMIKHLTEAERLHDIDSEMDDLMDSSEMLTEKINLARELPAEILKTAKIPVEGLTVVDGEPRIDRGKGPLPISNLSEGEQLELCVDVALSKSNNNGLNLVLIDGIEKLSEANRERLYSKCKELGLQYIATRTTDDNELKVVYL